MRVVESHLEGRWVSGHGDGEVLVDPTTEEPYARVATDGLDLAAALEFSRVRGGPALRSLTVQERAAALAAIGRALHGAREELIELSVRQGGSTRSDAKFDVDGATATLAAYAKLGAGAAGGAFEPDGEPVELGGARLAGLHGWVPREGVAVHVGAFNFPVWGWAEKAAVAWLAGMPVLTKPAPQTAGIAERSLRLALEAGALPEGALSVLSGPPGALLHHLGPQDVLAFTGSLQTAQRIRTDPRVVASGARVLVEADSLNAAVLLPGASDALVDAFVRDVIRDVTQKAGQKCTAIRRVFLPEELRERVEERLIEELRAARVGDPSRDDVRVGPLVDRRQVERAREALAALAAGGTILFQASPFEPVGVAPGRGCFFPPTLLLAEARDEAAPVHQVELFGPAASVVPYSGDPREAARLVRLAGGGLVASLYGDDRDLLSGLVRELVAWHGRIVVVDSKVADRSLPPGTVLPDLVHGGPGRAGGGEELGGLRGVRHYQHRVALQGNGALLRKLVPESSARP